MHKINEYEITLSQEEDESLVIMCDLLGIEAQQMAKWICNRKITTMAEVLITPITADQVSLIYHPVFSCI